MQCSRNGHFWCHFIDFMTRNWDGFGDDVDGGGCDGGDAESDCAWCSGLGPA